MVKAAYRRRRGSGARDGVLKRWADGQAPPDAASAARYAAATAGAKQQNRARIGHRGRARAVRVRLGPPPAQTCPTVWIALQTKPRAATVR